MNKLIKRVSLMVLGLVFFAPACTDLEEELYSDVTADNFFTSDEEFVAALGQAYSSLLGIGNHSNLWSINEIASDELVITTKGGDWYDGGILLQLHQHEYTADNGFFNNTWGFCYSGVNTCNRLIYQFEQLGTEEADAFIAELRAVRALWYYWLLDAFGNVPLVTDFTDTETAGNSTRQQVFNFVESELNEIIPLLSEAKDASTYGRINKWGALAIRAKLYLNAEVYTGTARWADAEADADAIINSGLYSLESNYASNFQTDNAGSQENIFVVPYDQVFAQGFNWHQMTLHYGSQNTFNLQDQPWNGYATVEEFYNSYIDPSVNPGPQGDVYAGLAQATSIGTVDSRLSNFIVGPQFNPDGSRTEDAGVEPTDPDGAPLTFTPQHNSIFPDGFRQAGARIGKYEIALGSTPNLSNDFVIFRLGNILLTKAEADFRQGNTVDALAMVNQIRSRAGVAPFTSLDANNLLAEWGREMYAEMTRRQDLIRFGKFDDPWWEKGSSDSHYAVFPIPQVQLDANNKLKQNEGYN
ncbi:MAG: RagB/SusD family nutrient uptake outer membrane protein [Marinoscillum sp.]|uniref:RagB/SusD family nutrient uptake outer membrane protein n=1 Tax=Marinoscillum sp. TaxID=2024838 RepID=UPI0032F673D9